MPERALTNARSNASSGQPLELMLDEYQYEAICDGGRVPWDLRFNGPAPRPEAIQALIDGLRVEIGYVE